MMRMRSATWLRLKEEIHDLPIKQGKMLVSSSLASNAVSMDTLFDQMPAKEISFVSFDTSSVTNMEHMFTNCKALEKLDLSTFNTAKVELMDLMFYGCERLKELDLSGFDTSHVRTMRRMFMGCSSLTKLDISSFDTSHVRYMNEMFRGCVSLTSLDLSGFDFSGNPNMRVMFEGCTNLKEVCISDTILEAKCEIEHVTIEYPYRNYSGPIIIDEAGDACIPGEGNSESQSYYNRIKLERDFAVSNVTYEYVPFSLATEEQRRKYLRLDKDTTLKIVPHRSKESLPSD